MIRQDILKLEPLVPRLRGARRSGLIVVSPSRTIQPGIACRLRLDEEQLGHRELKPAGFSTAPVAAPPSRQQRSVSPFSPSALRRLVRVAGRAGNAQAWSRLRGITRR